MRVPTLLLAALVPLAPTLALAQDAEPWKRAFPEATRIGEMAGEPPAAPAFRGDERIGWVVSSARVVDSRGYSGKPLDIWLGLDDAGIIRGATIVEQSEPIGATGATAADLETFVRGYAGTDIRRPLRVVRDGGTAGTVDAIAGATITSLTLNDAIFAAARRAAEALGVLETAAALDLDAYTARDWEALVGEGSVVRHRVSVGHARERFGDRHVELTASPEPLAAEATFVELTLALATPARIGRNLLGRRDYERLRGSLALGDHALFVGGDGLWSFKGTGWRRTGVFDRLRLVQGRHVHVFARDDYQRVREVAADGAPTFRDTALFVIPAEMPFDASRPFTLQLLVEAHTPDDARTFFGFDYEAPGGLVRRDARAADAGDDAGPLWRRIWHERRLDIAVLTAALGLLTTMLTFQRQLTRRRRLWAGLRTGFLAFTLVWLGWYATAQLSVVNVLTFTDALMTDFRWEQFLLEPLIFILWGYVAVTLVFWGRGVFCGWLCPFGALQELVHQVGRRLGVPAWDPPFAVHERLRAIKFVVFVGLFAVALGSTSQAHRLAEIEPFKTAVVLQFQRAWPFVLYAVALLAAGLVVQRFFCRYLCPLGAALALPARLRQFEWLKRRWQCGQRCRICEVTCPVQAIHPEGQIHPGECIYCLRCQVNYDDAKLCPVLVERARRQQARGGGAAT